MIKGDTRVHSLYGSPVAHSLSPVIFNSTFEKLSLNRTYIPFEVTREDLKKAVAAARTLGFDGFNVTMPLKTAIMESLDRLDDNAKNSGAVNTVSRNGKGLVGYNTDGEGAVRALRSYGFEPKSRRITVLGAGGAAQALVHRLSREKNTIKVLNRTPDKARKLADAATGSGTISFGPLDKENFEESLHATDLLVNATPARTIALLSQFGMPLSTVSETDWVFDLAYDKTSGSVPTRKGMISPLEMLVQQAALSFEIWLKETAPLALMRSSLVDYLGKDWK
ncbi:MAG TPA: shikimate dehydrogenase [Candidatus Bathyarchaeia archaeon]|nr:shikimate dehydrogenase [Candidatus Bathyarchaeia archaeon]